MVGYISLLKNSGAATKDFRADLPQKGCTELRASEKRFDKKIKMLLTKPRFGDNISNVVAQDKTQRQTSDGHLPCRPPEHISNLISEQDRNATLNIFLKFRSFRKEAAVLHLKGPCHETTWRMRKFREHELSRVYDLRSERNGDENSYNPIQ